MKRTPPRLGVLFIYTKSNQKKYLKLLTKNDIINVIGERNVRYKITVN